MIYDKTRALEPNYYDQFEMVYKPALERLEVSLGHALAFLELVVPHMGEPDTPNQKLGCEIAEELKDALRTTATDTGTAVKIGVQVVCTCSSTVCRCGKNKPKAHTDHLSGSWDKTCPACIANAKAGRGD